MTVFDRPDLIPLWDRPPEFLPLRPPSGLHHWDYGSVRSELERVAASLDKAASTRRVALLAHPDLDGAAATDGLHAGLQMLLAAESADDHRHTPAALRVGIEATDLITTVDGEDFQLGPLDVVLNPSGTWHGHTERGGSGAVWLDVVDLPLVSALGGVLFEPARSASTSSILDPEAVPTSRSFPWSEMEPILLAAEKIDGVRELSYEDGAVMSTLAVTAYAVEEGTSLRLPARTAGTVLLAARGSFGSTAGPMATFDVVSARSWTPVEMTSQQGTGIVIAVDTSPALRALGLYREEAAP